MNAATGKPVRLGLAGCGGIAFWAHLRSLRGLRSAVLVAAADPDAGARARAATLTRATMHPDAAELFARGDLDGVIVAAPTCWHAELGLAAVRAGLAVYLEKPMATNSAESAGLVEACRAARRPLTVGFNRRFHPVHTRAREWLAAGAIGRVHSVQGVFAEPLAGDSLPPWKRRRDSGGGVLLDLGSHHFDLVRWMLGDEPARVRATVRSTRTEQDAAEVELETVAGVAVQCRFSFHTGPADFLEFHGEDGTLRADRHRAWPELRIRRRRGYGIRPAWERPGGSLARLVGHALRPGHDPSYRRALAAWVDGVARGVAVGAGVDDGAASLAVVLAAEASAASGAWIAVRPAGRII